MACVFSGEYHDDVWGSPVLCPRALFAQLSLCTQQCGISWRVVWAKRAHYTAAFHDWDVDKVARMSDEDVGALCDPLGPWKGRLIQNRNKLSAIVHNAGKCLAIQQEQPGGLSGYLWSFVEGREERVNACADVRSEEYARVFGTTSEFSDALAAALKGTYGFRFLGSTTLQAFLLQNGQAG